MHFLFVDTGVSRFLVSFVLQPKTENIDLILQRINIYVDVKTPIEVFGLPMHMEPNSFKTSMTVWDGIKTVVRFELMMKYGSLEERGTLEGENQIAEFLHEQFQISLRDIYDITFMETEQGNTAVEFSLPPIMTKQKQTLLTNMEFFFGGSCEDTCKLQGNTDTVDECKSCGYVSVFGTNVYTDHQSFQSRTETWTGNERRFAMMEIESDVCPDHQEICTSGQSGSKCVGIGRCEPNFYKINIRKLKLICTCLIGQSRTKPHVPLYI
ncbi:uncharacterized protein LOC128549914 [Mercenaria mercenaria]|uniref:uncharacterized protein LOC128549914 n=1 Tax=Mercenaria mercenaria TaxID=6596 RepID=UPI00234F4028|nr:uncharacterized protein LOC128549914 [Mercenaria mercenaria]